MSIFIAHVPYCLQFNLLAVGGKCTSLKRKYVIIDYLRA